jgi:hypothetical protein
MSKNSNARVLNVSRGNTLKYRQAVKAVEIECSAEWVVEGESIRDLTLKEVIERRKQQKLLRDELGNTEIPGLVYEPPAQERNFKFQNERAMLLREAREFCRDGGTEPQSQPA